MSGSTKNNKIIIHDRVKIAGEIKVHVLPWIRVLPRSLPMDAPLSVQKNHLKLWVATPYHVSIIMQNLSINKKFVQDETKKRNQCMNSNGYMFILKFYIMVEDDKD